MRKELEALESIRRTIQQLDYGFISKEDCEDFKIIETALKDYEGLAKDYARLELDYIKLEQKLETIKREPSMVCWQKQKKVDAFDIVVNKDVEVGMLKGILHADKNLHTASYYNSYFVATYKHLTQEEFDLLKEVLL